MSLKATFRSAVIALWATKAAAAPNCTNSADAQQLANPDFGPTPGESSIYSTYYGLTPPFPANVTVPICPTEDGPPGPDDNLWQNLLAAEWAIFSFYQAGVEAFNTSSFTSIGFPNNTYQRIMQVRDNEAGHLRIFQNAISPTSLKPGPCKYQFPFDTPTSFLALSTLIEVASMAFLTGLVQEAKAGAVKGALMGVGQVETRHEAWLLTDAWNVDPFGGPSDTVFPYAKEILDVTNEFVVAGTCPSVNPPYPNIELNFTDPTNQPSFNLDTQYYAVFFHGVGNASVPIDTSHFPNEGVNVTIPQQFESKGVIIGVIADAEGAPTLESVIAGPSFFLQQPASLGTQVV
jgi:hypothetical protein